MPRSSVDSFILLFLTLFYMSNALRQFSKTSLGKQGLRSLTTSGLWQLSKLHPYSTLSIFPRFSTSYFPSSSSSLSLSLSLCSHLSRFQSIPTSCLYCTSSTKLYGENADPPEVHRTLSQQKIDEAMREDLKRYRKRIAIEEGKQPYHVFSNKAMENIITAKPLNDDELLDLVGVGKKTVSNYGVAIYKIISGYIDDQVKADRMKNISRDGPNIENRSRSKKSPKLKLTADTKRDIPSIDKMNDEQKAAAHRIINMEQSLFLTGSAGTGKSYLLQYVIGELQKKYGMEAVAISAPTGVAAVNIGGQTVHSFAGIGLGTGSIQSLVNRVKKSRQAVQRWQQTKILIIDEVSMLSRGLFDVLDEIARKIRKSDELFGGIQVILVGDFMQLPPVNIGSRETDFCFNSWKWRSLFADGRNIEYFSKMCRHNDPDFIEILNGIRRGDISSSLLSKLDECLVTVKPPPMDGIKPTTLYCTNRDVDEMNENELNKLSTHAEEFIARDIWRGETPSASLRKWSLEAAEKRSPKGIKLKVGAQVMLTRNRMGSSQHDDLYNGSRGVVEAFVESSTNSNEVLPLVRFDNGVTIPIGRVEFPFRRPGDESELVRFQLPLKLAWAMTVHKAQGSTLTRAELHLGNAFEHGQVYVALSRLRSLSGLWLNRRIPRTSIIVHPAVINYYKELFAMINSVENTDEDREKHGNDAEGMSGCKEESAPIGETEKTLSAPFPSRESIFQEDSGEEYILEDTLDALDQHQGWATNVWSSSTFSDGYSESLMANNNGPDSYWR